MVLGFLEGHHRLFHKNLLKSYSVTGFDLPEKREVCTDDGGDFPVAACDRLHKEDDRLRISGNLDRTRRNTLGDNGISQVLFSMKSGSGETNARSVG